MTEEIRHQRASELEALVRIMIAIIRRSSPQDSEKEFVDHISQKIGFFGFGVARGGDVGKDVICEETLGIADSILMNEGEKEMGEGRRREE